MLRFKANDNENIVGSPLWVYIASRTQVDLPSRFVEQIMRLWDGNGLPFSPVPRHKSSLHDSTGDFCGRGHNHCSQIYLKIYILKLC